MDDLQIAMAAALGYDVNRAILGEGLQPVEETAPPAAAVGEAPPVEAEATDPTPGTAHASEDKPPVEEKPEAEPEAMGEAESDSSPLPSSSSSSSESESEDDVNFPDGGNLWKKVDEMYQAATDSDEEDGPRGKGKDDAGGLVRHYTRPHYAHLDCSHYAAVF